MKNDLKPQKEITQKGCFWKGLMVGLFLGCFGLSVLILGIIRLQGFTIAINPEILASVVQEKVRTEVKNNIPQLLHEVKKELPQEIEKHLEDFDSLKISFGSSNVQLPIEISAAFKSEMNSIIEAAIIDTLNEYNETYYEDKIAKDAYIMVDNMLRNEIIGKTYLIQPSKWLTFPIKIIGSSKHHFQMEL